MQTVCKAKGKVVNLVLMATLSLVGGGNVRDCFGQSTGQKTFKTPQAASDALVQAAKDRNKETALSILGAGGNEVLFSGDPDEDARRHQLFVDKYQQMHRFVTVGKHTDIVYIGAENWPLPIPLVNGKEGWYFDTEGAKREILFRRIGENELSAISVCLAIVAAQNEYKGQLHDGEKVNQFAQRFMSSDGKHDGLYWKAQGSELKSPLGPRLALAASQVGQAQGAGEPKPYHGYIYRMLTAQGKSAPGGAKDYLAGGKLTQGFAVVAYPARFKVSGVTTLIVNQDGIVYQKDLGPDTAKIASAIQAYDPDQTWIPAN